MCHLPFVAARMVPSGAAVGQVDPRTLGVPPNTPPYGLAGMASPDFIQGNNIISYSPVDRLEGLIDTSAPPAPLPEMPSMMPSQPVAPELIGTSISCGHLCVFELQREEPVHDSCHCFPS
jgi:hypothetical protein